MVLPVVGACLWTATKGAGLGLITSVGTACAINASQKEKSALFKIDDIKILAAIGAVAGAALALLSLIFGTLPMLGMLLGAGTFIYLNKDALNGGDKDAAAKVILGTIGCALVGFVAGAVFGAAIAPAAVIV